MYENMSQLQQISNNCLYEYDVSDCCGKFACLEWWSSKFGTCQHTASLNLHVVFHQWSTPDQRTKMLTLVCLTSLLLVNLKIWLFQIRQYRGLLWLNTHWWKTNSMWMTMHVNPQAQIAVKSNEQQLQVQTINRHPQWQAHMYMKVCTQ